MEANNDDALYKNKYLKYKNKYMSLKGGGVSYDKQWSIVTPEIWNTVTSYYDKINLDFLENKVERELANGNAGGPPIRAHYPESLTNNILAQASIRGLKKLLIIKTIENACEFKIKSFLDDRSLLTDLAWHSLMLKPQYYYMITNSILDKIKNMLNNNMDYVTKSVNNYTLTNTITIVPLIRHGTFSDTTFIDGETEETDTNTDIIEIINKKFYNGKINDDLEWNLPNPPLWSNIVINKK